MPPLRFAALVGDAALATSANPAVPRPLALVGFAVAVAAIELRDRWIERRASKLVDWEQFAWSLAAYADTRGADSHRST